jgi:hypothetical protein
VIFLPGWPPESLAIVVAEFAREAARQDFYLAQRGPARRWRWCAMDIDTDGKARWRAGDKVNP